MIHCIGHEQKYMLFFEAFYINENVVGLLQYLIKNILPNPPTIPVFEKQDSISFATVTNSNIKLNSSYRFLMQKASSEPVTTAKNVPSMVIEPISLVDHNPDPIIDDDNKNFAITFGINRSTGTFVDDTKTNKEVFEAERAVIERINKGTYDSNKIFRDGGTNCTIPTPIQIKLPIPKGIPPAVQKMANEKNYPLLQDFLEPYAKKIQLYYVFYVVTNNKNRSKAEEQIKLLNNSIPFIRALYSSDDPKKKNNVSNRL